MRTVRLFRNQRNSISLSEILLLAEHFLAVYPKERGDTEVTFAPDVRPNCGRTVRRHRAAATCAAPLCTNGRIERVNARNRRLAKHVPGDGDQHVGAAEIPLNRD